MSRLRLTLRDAARHVARIIEQNDSVTVTRTGYTIHVKTDRRSYFFADNGTSPRTFGVNEAIKKDITERAPILWDEHAHPSAVRYHGIADGPLPDRCYCVDIKAAYPSTMSILGMISKRTHTEAMALPKPDRLKTVGMLATRKYVETYKMGERIKADVIESPFRPWFFDVCHYVGDVMREAAEASGDSFHLFWVDGIFTSKPDAVREVLQDVGYSVSVDAVEGIRRSSDGSVVRYTKGGKSTYLCLPVRRRVDASDIVREIVKLRTQAC